MRTFPHKTRSPPLDFSHYMVFEKRMTETQSFRNINSLLWADHTNIHPSTCWSTSSRANATYLTMLEPIIACGCTRKFLAWIILWSLWAWVAVQKKNRQSWNTQVPQSTQMCVLVATLSKPLINNLTSVMEISQTQSTSTSIAWQYNSNVEVTPKGLINKTGNRYYLNYIPIPTI